MTVIDSSLDTLESLWDCLLPGEVIDAPGGWCRGRYRSCVSSGSGARDRPGDLRHHDVADAENADAEELASLHRVIAEAQAHLDRMRAASSAL